MLQDNNSNALPLRETKKNSVFVEGLIKRRA